MLTDLFKPILHTLLLIWHHSPHYNSAPRLVTLIREACNDLIMQARRFIPGEGRGRGSTKKLPAPSLSCPPPPPAFLPFSSAWPSLSHPQARC